MAKLKANNVKCYIESGVNAEKNVIRCMAIVGICLFAFVQFMAAYGQGGVYCLFPTIVFPLSIAALIAIFIITARPKKNKRRLIINLLLSSIYFLNSLAASIVHCFMAFGINALCLLALLPPFITCMLMPIKIQKDVGNRDKKRIKAIKYTSTTVSGIGIGVVAGLVGSKIGEIAFKDVTQIFAIGFSIILQVTLSCFMAVSIIGNIVKLYWLIRLEKHDVNVKHI